MIDLKESRKNIDEIDRKIVELFEQRMVEANAVAEYKLETGKAVYDKQCRKRLSPQLQLR